MIQDANGLRFSADELARMLVGAGARSGPLYRQLSDSLAELIDRGELPPAAVLPPERALATALTVSRTTVVAAYQALRESGRLERRQGSGTTVSAGRARETVSGGVLAGDHAASQFLNGPLATIDFATAALPSLDLVADVAAGLTRDDYLRLTGTHHGYHLRGLPALRERIARWYSDAGMPTAPEDILITSGAQQALELVARGCLQPGDGVVVEQPTYRGALEAFGRTGSRMRTVRIDDEGLDVIALEKLLATESPRLVYVQTAAHNPTGVVLSDDRRQRLARLLDQHEVVLVDDTSLSGTSFDGRPYAPALATHERLVTIGSMSKLFWGGLRLGWIRAVPQAVSRFAQVRGITDLGSSLVAQEVALRLMDHRPPRCRRGRATYRAAGRAADVDRTARPAPAGLDLARTAGRCVAVGPATAGRRDPLRPDRLAVRRRAAAGRGLLGRRQHRRPHPAAVFVAHSHDEPGRHPAVPGLDRLPEPRNRRRHPHLRGHLIAWKLRM
ncbi:PLP-dependent aminotransferase family protein [Kribbella sp. NPDC049227]|uniref:aminotransferase-like domain-containing protein n=1 Tax=Kribbella sp. NPDC049227 TaxID=3364113 RepID=UPI003718A604